MWWIHTYWIYLVDDVLWIFFSAQLINESMNLWGLPTTKNVLIFLLNTCRNLTFPSSFGMAYRHFRANLKHDLQLGDLKASLINCAEKLIYKTSSNNKIILWCCFWIRPAEQHFTWAKNLLARSTIVIIKANHSSTSSDPSFGSISSICN